MKISNLRRSGALLVLLCASNGKAGEVPTANATYDGESCPLDTPSEAPPLPTYGPIVPDHLAEEMKINQQYNRMAKLLYEEDQVPENELPPQDGWMPPDFDTLMEEQDYYGPKDRFWRHHANTKTLLLGGVDYYPKIETCMNNLLTPKEWQQIHRPQNLKRRMGKRLMDRWGEGPVLLVEIQNAMSPIHAKAVQVLNECVREHIPFLHEKRPMYQVYQVDEESSEELKETMGGNNPTHLNSIISIFLPYLIREQYKTLQMAYQAAGWNSMVVRDQILNRYRANDIGTEAAFADWKDVGARAVEFLSYEGFNNLMQHQDGYATSVVLNVMLSDPKDYEGGRFYIRDNINEDLHTIRPGQYSAVAFLGGTHDHGVDTIHGGKREALSTEYWYYPDLPFGVNLCAAEFRNIEGHIEQCNEVQYDPATDSYDYDIPCDLPFPSQSIYGICHSQMGTIKDKDVYKEEDNGEGQPQDLNPPGTAGMGNTHATASA